MTPPGTSSKRYFFQLSLAAMGIVFGDIGTSPLYALRECFHAEHGILLVHDNIIGVLSLIFWSLTLIISIKYLSYVVRADNKGEGGILALMALASQQKLNRHQKKVLFMLGLFGAALLYGDSVITPAISVLSAVEGLSVASESMNGYVIPITITILIFLFSMQDHGTARLGKIFGPITLLWFIVIAILGVNQIIHEPHVLIALNPLHGFRFLMHHGWNGFLVLGAVFLVVTGGEALYADMGHFGRAPLQATWFFIAGPSLILNYFGQGALLIRQPESISNPFYHMAPAWALYPLLILATIATIIASQAVISGAFSVTRQASMLGLLPRIQIIHTSANEIGQIYVPSVNRVLMLATIGLVLGFESSTHLAAAYGIAVTTTMVITTMLSYIVARYVWKWSLWVSASITLVFLVPDIAFFSANLIKISHGGWFPLLVALVVFGMMSTWKKGRALLNDYIQDNTVDLDDFYELMRVERPLRVPGTAVYMTGNALGAPPALIQNFTHNRVVHENNVLLTVKTEASPRVSEKHRVEIAQLEHGFVRVIVHYGFLENPEIPKLLARISIPGYSPDYATFFVGIETLIPSYRKTGMFNWRKRIFAFMARNAQRATAFFDIPPDRVIEIGTQIKI